MSGDTHSGGPRETHVRHTRVEELYRRERELLREKVEAWLRGELRESRTAWVGMRVTPTLKELYSRAPDHVKLAARRAFEAVVLSWFLGSGSVQYQQSLGQPMIFNISISHSEARAEARIPGRLIRLLDDLEGLLDFLAHRSDPQRYPEPVRRRAQQGLRALRELRGALYEWN